ncbi:MAG: tetratricopeptide repeat protein [Terracidiphilus sp.]
MLRSAIPALLFACALSVLAQNPPGTTIPDAGPGSPGLDPAVAAAEAALVKSDWATAENSLAPYLVSHPNDARALFDAGYACDADNKPDQAEAFYGRAVQADPKSFEAQLALGLLLARQGKLDDARPHLAAATQLDPGPAGPATKARAWRAMAQIDRRTDPTEASNDLLEALKLSSETPEDTLLAAQLAEQTGELDAAEKAYRRVIAEDPKNTDAAAGLGHILLEHKQYAEAETLLRAAQAQRPDDPVLTAQLAAALAGQDKAEALPLLEKLHDAHPEDENITRMLAEVESEAGKTAESDLLYTQLIAAHPGDAGLYTAHGENLIRQQKNQEAFAAFSRATEIDSTDADAWSGLAFAASKTGQPSIALHALTMRSKYLPENASTYFLWATSYDTLHDRNAAITYYHHFLEASAGKFPDQEWQARQRLLLLERKP